jgi:CTP:phosphocholine cytidylyltransferase-like protein
MDMIRAKELIKELTVLVDQIDDDKISEFNKMTQKHQLEIKIKLMAILNELDIRPLQLGSYNDNGI